jgi:hypothetical protein
MIEYITRTKTLGKYRITLVPTPCCKKSDRMSYVGTVSLSLLVNGKHITGKQFDTYGKGLTFYNRLTSKNLKIKFNL